MLENKNTIDKLMQLSKIFKRGFTIAIENGLITQGYYEKGYAVSYKSIVSINLNTKVIKLRNTDIPLNTTIGGWLDIDTNVYHIDLNIVYHLKSFAISEAKKYKQKAIYDLKKQEVIEV